MRRADTRHAILEAGIKVVLTKGYHECGLSEILQDARVPKGSFYYYFASKEEFGLQLIEHWLENFAEAEATLKDESLSPLLRVRRFFEALPCIQKAAPPVRHRRWHPCTWRWQPTTKPSVCRVERLLAAWQQRVAECLAQAQQLGEIHAGQDAAALAEFCLISWEGAVQRRTIQSTTPSTSSSGSSSTTC